MEINFDMTPLILQLLRTDAAVHALAKSSLSEDQLKKFNDEFGNQFKISVREFLKDNPTLKISGRESLEEMVK